jgi:hypothetical protein
VLQRAAVIRGEACPNDGLIVGFYPNTIGVGIAFNSDDRD